MRHFGTVDVVTECAYCGVELQPTVAGEYSPRTIVTYTDCTVRFPYCSDRCINADYERSAEIAESLTHHSAHLEADYLNKLFDAHVEALGMNAQFNADNFAADLAVAVRHGLTDELIRYLGWGALGVTADWMPSHRGTAPYVDIAAGGRTYRLTVTTV